METTSPLWYPLQAFQTFSCLWITILSYILNTLCFNATLWTSFENKPCTIPVNPRGKVFPAGRARRLAEPTPTIGPKQLRRGGRLVAPSLGGLSPCKWWLWCHGLYSLLFPLEVLHCPVKGSFCDKGDKARNEDPAQLESLTSINLQGLIFRVP